MFPEFLPVAVNQLTEPASIALAEHIQQVPVKTDFSDRPLASTHVHHGQGQPPLLLLHGFDSSLLEFRRFLPEVAAFSEIWAVDLLGFGFCDRTLPSLTNPINIRDHLFQFWQQQIRSPVVLVGASMGGAAAIDFTLTYPEVVHQLILIDAAGMGAGPNMGRWMLPPLDRWATNFLKNPGVRRRISQQAYFDQALVTPDAEVCASLHLHCRGWAEALIAFTKSGGYNCLSSKISEIIHPTLIIWGRQDKILGTQDAVKFQRAIAHSTLVWIEDCGHIPHLEQPTATAQAVHHWLQTID
jgi:pimeloyl-ACP methyl ester carboxylesterase